MTERPLPPPQRSLAEVLDEVRLHDELEEMQAMDAAELEQALADAGYDGARTAERIAAAREAAYSELVAAPVPVAEPPPRVVSLDAARAKRAASTRWGSFSVAAGLLLALGLGGEQYAAHVMPARTVEYPTSTLPPSPEKLAEPWRRAASRSCQMGYYAECADLLDEARKLDPEGEHSPRVEALRHSIDVGASRRKDEQAPPLNAKGAVGPTERPLQPRH